MDILIFFWFENIELGKMINHVDTSCGSKQTRPEVLILDEDEDQYEEAEVEEVEGDEDEGDDELDSRKSISITTDLDRTTECRNLAYDTTESDLQPIFERFGKIEEVSTTFFFALFHVCPTFPTG